MEYGTMFTVHEWQPMLNQAGEGCYIVNEHTHQMKFVFLSDVDKRRQQTVEQIEALKAAKIACAKEGEWLYEY